MAEPRTAHRRPRQAGHYADMDASHRAAATEPPAGRYGPPAGMIRMYRGIGSNVWDAQSGDALFF